MFKLTHRRAVFPIFLLLLLAGACTAQTFTTLVDFDGSNSAMLPSWSLIQGLDGGFYGSTEGTVFSVTSAGALTTVQSVLYSHLSVQGLNGAFYGTTPSGGARNSGTVFKLTAAGTLTTLYSFCSQSNCVDGVNPYGGLVLATDGNFYGTTTGGGMHGHGTVFKITAAGKLTTLCSFTAIGFAGTALVEGVDGNFYGTTSDGGANGKGSVFSVTPLGALTTLHSFTGSDGSSPYDALIVGADGSLYGTTYSGGASNNQLCDGIGCGTMYRMARQGRLKTIYNFCSQSGCVDGQFPYGDLLLGSDGNFYGTTNSGGAFGQSCPFGICGTVFQITPQGALTTLHSFQGSDGSSPFAGLLQGTDGSFYGSTGLGGTFSCGGTGCGTVFKISTGLSAFVATRPASGKVGQAVIILGNNLKGSTAVSFNGTPATFKIDSNTAIRTTVPAGATTGEVEVTTPAGVLKSNVVFRVR